jgi:hypothetical protein
LVKKNCIDPNHTLAAARWLAANWWFTGEIDVVCWHGCSIDIVCLSFPWRLMNMPCVCVFSAFRDRWTPFAWGSGCWRRKSDRDDVIISIALHQFLIIFLLYPFLCRD